MLYSIVLVSAKRQHESATGIHVSPPLQPPFHLLPHSTPVGCYRARFEFPKSYNKLPLAIYFTYGNCHTLLDGPVAMRCLWKWLLSQPETMAETSCSHPWVTQGDLRGLLTEHYGQSVVPVNWLFVGKSLELQHLPISVVSIPWNQRWFQATNIMSLSMELRWDTCTQLKHKSDLVHHCTKLCRECVCLSLGWLWGSKPLYCLSVQSP